jgi:glycosyltransferase involved in cell wall biosynthesis
LEDPQSDGEGRGAYLKIAVVAPTEIPARRANTMQVMKMAQALVILGHQVHLVAPGHYSTENSDAPALSPCRKRIKENSDYNQDAIWRKLSHHYGIKHQFSIDWLQSAPPLRRYDYGMRSVLWARSLKADLLYTRLPQSAAIASRMGLATILETHDLPQGNFGGWFFLHFIRGKGARRLVVITKALANDISKEFEIDCLPPFTIIAPDGVDLERYSYIPEPSKARLALVNNENTHLEQRLPVERFTVGYTGHLYRGRGAEMFLDLAARLPDYTFLIVGGEPQDVSHLQGMAHAQQLDNLILTGFIPNSELPQYQAACDVLVMPYQLRVEASSGGDISRYLSPMKLFEYLACQRAIISSDLPVLQEVLNSQNAILLSGEDVNNWIGAIKKLHSKPELRRKLAIQARNDADLYTWENRATRILEGL